MASSKTPFKRKSSRKKTTTPLFSMDNYFKGSSSKHDEQASSSTKILCFQPQYSKNLNIINSIHNNQNLQISKKLFKVLPQINHPNTFQYFLKVAYSSIFEMETFWINRYSNLDEFLLNLFPSKFYFMTYNIKKSREYYEAILTKIGSAIITHTLNQQNPKRIYFSKNQHSKGVVI